MLRLALVEELRRLADGVVSARKSREKARRWHEELARGDINSSIGNEAGLKADELRAKLPAPKLVVPTNAPLLTPPISISTNQP